jgi:O-antigen/teichoic acid export membrane protein
LLRALTPAEAGTYFATLALGLVVFSVADLNLGSVALAEASKDQSESEGGGRSSLSDLLGARALTWTLAWGVVATVAVLVSDFVSLAAALIIYLWLLLVIVTGIQQVPLQVELRQGLISSLLVVQAVLALGAVTLLASVDAPVWSYLSVQLPGLLLSSVVLALKTRAEPRLRPALHLGRTVAILRTHWLLGVATVLGVVTNRLGPLLTLWVAGRVEAGRYGAGFRLADALEAIAPLLMSVSLPLFARTDQSGALESARLLRQVLAGMITVGILVGCALAIWGGHVLPVLAGSEYAGLHGLFGALGFFIAAAFLLQPLNYFHLAGRRYRPLVAGAATGCLVLIVTTIWWAGAWGAVGAAWATAAAFASFAVLSALAAARVAEGRLLAVLIAKGLLIAGLCFTIALAPWHPVVQTVLVLVIATALTGLLRLVGRDDVRALAAAGAAAPLRGEGRDEGSAPRIT